MDKDHRRESVDTATLAGGCFWCLEAVFTRVQGVIGVVSGYTGGDVADPTYEQVSSGTTRHAEAVRITFDPGVISFREILEIFFAVHDPTTPDRQGPDIGPQYRSAIFYHTPGQKSAAEAIINTLRDSGVWDRPIVTEVRPLTAFYLAEEYHQRYYERHPEQAYCQLVINPKLDKLRQKLAGKLKK